MLPAPENQQARLLAEAATRGWSVRELRSSVAALKGPRKGGPKPRSWLVHSIRALDQGARRIEEAIVTRAKVDPSAAEELRALADRIGRLLAVANTYLSDVLPRDVTDAGCGPEARSQDERAGVDGNGAPRGGGLLLLR